MYTDVKLIPNIVKALRDTFHTGLTKDIAFRRQQLNNIKKLLKEKEVELVQAVANDLHKHELEIITGEIGPVMGEVEYMLKNIDKLSKPTPIKAQYKMNSMDKLSVRKEPKGVVLVIGSWNYPLHLLLLPVVGAIAAGNCVVIKPSEVANHTASLMGKLIPEYLDPRAYTIVQGGVTETTALLTEEFNHIFYTGNGNVGKIVMAAASKHLTPVTLELGGKSPVIIAPDANLGVAARRILWGKLYNGGQTCIAPDYILISRNQTQEFLEACRKVIHERYGDNPQLSDSYCRMIGERRFDALQSFLDHLDPSKIVIGGQTDRKDLYIAPTIVSPIDPNEKGIMEEEIFGPILPIVPVDSVDEAIRVVNSKDTPLALYIFTDNKDTREKILNNTQSGGVVVNDLLMQVQELGLPFGGVGPSGMGNYHGHKSFDTFTHERATMIKSSGLESAMGVRYPPYNNDKKTIFALLMFGLPDAFFDKLSFMYNFVGAAFAVTSAKKNRNSSKL